MNLYEFYPKIFEKKIPLNLLGIASRNYLHWKKENLVTSSNEDKSIPNEKRERVLLNVFDALWLLIIKELREFNVDFPTIRAVKGIMYGLIQFDHDKLASISTDDFINSILKNIPEDYHEVIKPILLDGSFLTMIDSFIDKKNIILFKHIGNVLFEVLIRQVTVSLIIKKNDGFVEVEFMKNDPNEAFTDVAKAIAHSLTNTTFINVPLVPLVAQLFEDSSFDKYTFQFGLFDANEKKIIDALNDDLCKEIKITKHQSGDLTMNLTFEENLKNEHAKEVRKILGLKQYEKIELVYRNDKHLIINNTRREILKK